jgi:hypothetical protein
MVAAAEPPVFVADHSARDIETRPDPRVGDGALYVSRRVSLVVVFLLSLTLWAAIWAVVASLVSVGRG